MNKIVRKGLNRELLGNPKQALARMVSCLGGNAPAVAGLEKFLNFQKSVENILKR